jgi:hypothetical protein
MREISLALLVVSVTLSAPALGAPTSPDPPLADAGLDQTVSLGSTVLLDGTGSRDPEGEIAAYEWRIIAPNGTERSPACPSCGRTEFTPTTTGNYTVQLSVTGEDGQTSTDTLYVNVTSGDPPAISASGPTTADVGTPMTYTANVRRGGAPLEEVVWRIDGEAVDRQSVSSDRDTVTLDSSFATPGDRIVTAIVRDREGRQSEEVVTTSVEPPAPTPPQNDQDQPDSSESASRPAIDPVLRGEQLLTGTDPFRGEYTVDTNRSASQIDRVQWIRDGEANGTGLTTSVSWSPGGHTLAAIVTYDDGQETRVVFQDGTSQVYVDARPDISFRQINNDSTLTGSVDVSDANGNLQQVIVEVNGTTVMAWDARESLGSTRVYEEYFEFSYDEGSLGSRHNVTATAIDSRGQRDVVSTTGARQAEPEIVRSEFVNGPVDSYHENISEDRYAAHHVVEVDLDGMSPGDIDVIYSTNNINLTELDSREYHSFQNYNAQDETLTYHSYWAGSPPDSYDVYVDILSNSGGNLTNDTQINSFQVTPSPPEVRVEITHGGAFPHISDRGMFVDARNSFDPDGTNLEFTWGQEATSTEVRGVGDFDTFRLANLTIEDSYGLQSEMPHSFQHQYTPEVADVEELSSGPYNSTDSIRFAVYSERFRFTKDSFHEDHQIGASAAPNAHVRHLNSDMIGEQEANADPDHTAGEQYVAIVEVDASVFSEDRPSPTVTFYNVENPDTTERSITLETESRIFVEGQTQRANMRIQDVSYVVSIPSRIERTVNSPGRRDELLEGEYRLDRSTQSGTEYVIEERAQVQEPEYDHERETFGTRVERDQFMDQHEGWESAGTETRYRTRTVTNTEWRNSRSGRGEFTGDTRRVQTAPPTYRTEREYEYQDQITQTRTVTEERSFTVPIFGGGSREVTRTITREETYTETVTRSYWSTNPRSPSHQSTGATRTERVSPPEYDTLYEYRYQTEERETTTEYIASRRVQTQQAEYEWQYRETVTSQFIADEIVASDGSLRIAREQNSTEWTLSRPGPSRNITVEEYDDPDRVVQTTARVSGDVVAVSEQINGDEQRQRVTREFTTTYTGDGLASEETIREELRIIEGVAEPCHPERSESGCEA